MDTYITIKNGGEGYYTDRRSKFYAFAHHVTTADEVRDVLSDYRRRYHDARHVCYAYIIGVEGIADGVTFRMNDDGEPSSTAGRPIYGQMVKAGLTDTLVVVVRYYGGVNLGTSGLIAAYREAAADCLAKSITEERTVEETITHTFAYPAMNEVMKIVHSMPVRVVSQTFDNTCSITLAIAHSKSEELMNRLKTV